MRCRCGAVFCEKHRPPESHGCSFDWRGMQQRKVAQNNPQVVKSVSSITSAAAWYREYDKYHATDGPIQRRRAQQLHACGVLLFGLLSVRGVCLAIAQWRFLPIPQQMVLGYLLGLACSRFAPSLLLGEPCCCRFCLFSWEFLQHPGWSLEAEWEALKEQLIFCVTFGKNNCLTRKLYDGPRRLDFICQTVVARLKELSAGGGTPCCS